MSEDYKKKYEELLKQMQEGQRPGFGQESPRDFHDFGGWEGFFKQAQDPNNVDAGEFRKKYEEVLNQRRGEMADYFSQNRGENFGEKFLNRFNQMVAKDDFFWTPQWEKTKSVTLSLRIDLGLKQWLENLADELGTSASKVVERALFLLRAARTISEPDHSKKTDDSAKSEALK